ncbi:MAG: hypothetical protein OXR66_03805 [Candidatus Woesearchaeota archaeon]|nr:hypothetical protein [Candidatus Woesearchaeota archaeon]
MHERSLGRTVHISDPNLPKPVGEFFRKCSSDYAIWQGQAYSIRDKSRRGGLTLRMGPIGSVPGLTCEDIYIERVERGRIPVSMYEITTEILPFACFPEGTRDEVLKFSRSSVARHDIMLTRDGDDLIRTQEQVTRVTGAYLDRVEEHFLGRKIGYSALEPPFEEHPDGGFRIPSTTARMQLLQNERGYDLQVTSNGETCVAGTLVTIPQ